MSSKNTYIKLNSKQIPLNIALPFNIYNSSGVLLIGKGQTVMDADQLEKLLKRDPCIDQKELNSLAQQVNKTINKVILNNQPIKNIL